MNVIESLRKKYSTFIPVPPMNKQPNVMEIEQSSNAANNTLSSFQILQDSNDIDLRNDFLVISPMVKSILLEGGSSEDYYMLQSKFKVFYDKYYNQSDKETRQSLDNIKNNLNVNSTTITSASIPTTTNTTPESGIIPSDNQNLNKVIEAIKAAQNNLNEDTLMKAQEYLDIYQKSDQDQLMVERLQKIINDLKNVVQDTPNLLTEKIRNSGIIQIIEVAKNNPTEDNIMNAKEALSSYRSKYSDNMSSEEKQIIDSLFSIVSTLKVK